MARPKASGRTKGKLPLAPQIDFPADQRFACRDCPARCCSTPWGIPVSEPERERILADDEARQRLRDRGSAILRAGILPMREQGQQLVCVFLDEDQLCSLHRRRGHEFIPANCQAYPFGFAEDEDGRAVALLSRYCPSIRDGYGEPISSIIHAKLKQAGGAHPMADRFGLRSGRTLPRKECAAVVEEWMLLVADSSVPLSSALARAYDLADEVDEALQTASGAPSLELSKQLIQARGAQLPTRPDSRGVSFDARVLYSYLLGGLCYPTRVLQPHRIAPPTLWERVRSWANRLVWLLGFGTVLLLFVERPVRVHHIGRVAPFLDSKLATGQLVREYLLEVLRRRQGLSHRTYLQKVVVDLALMMNLISRFARAAASSEAKASVELRHVKEGIGVAELLFTHQRDDGVTGPLVHLRSKLLSSRESFRKMLAQEAAPR